MPIQPSFPDSLRDFAQTVRRAYSIPIPGQPEDQLKSPIQRFLAQAGAALRYAVASRTESPVENIEARPDIGVSVNNLLCGHVELKAPGKGARVERYKGADKQQWEKFKALPNLIYTDGSEWGLYRTGERKQLVRFEGDVTVGGVQAFTQPQIIALGDLFLDFFSWTPIVPSNPRGLAKVLAPLCRLLRRDVESAIGNPTSNLSILAAEWRTYLFPDADDAQFADAYAQTLTYALLLAKLSGDNQLNMDSAAERIRSGHRLLSQALRVLGQPEARSDIELAVGLLERCINAIDAEPLNRAQPDVWLYFYEDFLAEYDPKLRKDRGVYYTPVQAVQAQVRLVAQLLKEKFGKLLSFADDAVCFLDPAVGTGTYPLAALNHALTEVRKRFGPGLIPARASVFVENLHAFEILVGPYAVSHLRISQTLQSAGAHISEPLKVLLTDTLESPHTHPPPQPSLLFRRLSEEHLRAQGIKSHTRILVCMGNPPYDRQVIEAGDESTDRKGGWVRFGDPDRDEEPLLDSFLAPLRSAGLSVHAKNLYNDYVYFWRWALWKIFEQNHESGVVCFITASSYLRGPGFIGMRRLIRQICDDVWIIDLEGDSRGPRKTENIFAIKTPVAIAIAVRYGEPRPDIPAQVRYCKITGSSEEKLQKLGEINSYSDLRWHECYLEWDKPLLPIGSGDYFSWPLVADLCPWQHSGVQFKRKWPIGPTRGLLENRWQAIIASSPNTRPELFAETEARKASGTYRSITTGGQLRPITALNRDQQPEPIVRYGYRSFDRQWAIQDGRLCDRPRPPLWYLAGERQVYFVSFLTGVMGSGPAIIASAEVPDLDYFRGSFGGKHVIPLWLDPAGTQANMTDGLLERIGEELQVRITPQEFFSYLYCVLFSPAFTDIFSEELVIPGPRLPITKDASLFRKAANVGAALIWLHTFGHRFERPSPALGMSLQGSARCTVSISTDPAVYPDTFSYEETTQALHVGNGEFAPVSPEVWKFEVSGLFVVESWLRYRMQAGYGRRSSRLDEIRPERWTAQMTEELLQILWVLENTVRAQSTLASLLEQIVSGPTFKSEELPQPRPIERKPPIGDEEVISAQMEIIET